MQSKKACSRSARRLKRQNSEHAEQRKFKSLYGLLEYATALDLKPISVLHPILAVPLLGLLSRLLQAEHLQCFSSVSRLAGFLHS